MKNSKLVLMTIISFSAALIASEETSNVVVQESVETAVVSPVIEVTETPIESTEAPATESNVELVEAPVITQESVESTEAPVTELTVESVDTPVIAQESVEKEVASIASTDASSVVETTTPSYLDIAKAKYNDFVAFSSEKMSLTYDYAQENPVMVASVATAAVTIAGISYYAYTQCGKAKSKTVKKN